MAVAGFGVSASGSQVPQSQTITSPAPYCFAGITPSKSKYSIGWSSTWTAIRRTAGSSVGPFGTAQLSEDAVDLEPEVVVEPGRPMTLDDEPTGAAPARTVAAGRLRRLREVALAAVLLERHRGQSAAVAAGVERAG